MSTTHKPVALVERKGSFYHDDTSLVPLTDEQIDKIEDAMEEWMQKEPQVRKIIYSTVDQSTFHQVKGEPTAADIWKKLVSIHGSKGAMYLLAQLQNTCFVENSEIDIYIHTSMSLAPTCKPLFTTLATSACTSEKSISSQDLIWHLNEEDGHTKERCFEEGGGMVGKAPEWWLKKHKGKGKDKADKGKSANAAETEDKEENYAFLNSLAIDTPDINANENVTLAVTSGHNHKAHAASPSAGIIIDCSASSHFLPSHE
ncbi:hypothetical protein C0993_008024, partial [Termitomyces sp. T159_Od127]